MLSSKFGVLNSHCNALLTSIRPKGLPRYAQHKVLFKKAHDKIYIQVPASSQNRSSTLSQDNVTRPLSTDGKFRYVSTVDSIKTANALENEKEPFLKDSSSQKINKSDFNSSTETSSMTVLKEDTISENRNLPMIFEKKETNVRNEKYFVEKYMESEENSASLRYWKKLTSNFPKSDEQLKNNVLRLLNSNAQQTSPVKNNQNTGKPVLNNTACDGTEQALQTVVNEYSENVYDFRRTHPPYSEIEISSLLPQTSQQFENISANEVHTDINKIPKQEGDIFYMPMKKNAKSSGNDLPTVEEGNSHVKELVELSPFANMKKPVKKDLVGPQIKSTLKKSRNDRQSWKMKFRYPDELYLPWRKKSVKNSVQPDKKLEKPTWSSRNGTKKKVNENVTQMESLFLSNEKPERSDDFISETREEANIDQAQNSAKEFAHMCLCENHQTPSESSEKTAEDNGITGESSLSIAKSNEDSMKEKAEHESFPSETKKESGSEIFGSDIMKTVNSNGTCENRTDSHQMDAIVANLKRCEISILKVPVPTHLKKDEVMVQVAYAGANFVDIRLLESGGDGEIETIIPGRELSGFVCGTGEEVSNVKAGDEIIVAPCLPHTLCKFCSQQKSSVCIKERVGRSIGVTCNGGWADFCVVPGSIVYKAPNVSLKQAVMLPQLAQIMCCLKRLNLSQDMKILIEGCGLVGSILALLLKRNGYEKVSICEDNRVRKRIIEEMNTGFPVFSAMELCANKADVVLANSAGADAMQRALTALNPHGQFIILGPTGTIEDNQNLTISPSDISRRQLRISGLYGTPSTPSNISPGLVKDLLDFSKLGIETYPMDNFKEGLTKVATGDANYIVLEMKKANKNS